MEHNIISKKGSWYSYGETRLGQGKEATREELKKNEKLSSEIETIIMRKISPTERRKGSDLPPLFRAPAAKIAFYSSLIADC